MSQHGSPLGSGSRVHPEALEVYLVLSIVGLDDEVLSVLPGLLRWEGCWVPTGAGQGRTALPQAPGHRQGLAGRWAALLQGQRRTWMPVTSLTKGEQCETLYFA